MDYRQHKHTSYRNLEQLLQVIKDNLPRYNELITQGGFSSKDEQREYLDLSDYLSEIAERVTEIKELLEENDVGNSLDLYYRVKEKAAKGDEKAIDQLKRMKTNYAKSLKGDYIFRRN